MWSCFDIGVMNWKKSTELWSSCMAQGVWCREAQVDKENVDSTTKRPKSKTGLTILFWLMRTYTSRSAWWLMWDFASIWGGGFLSVFTGQTLKFHLSCFLNHCEWRKRLGKLQQRKHMNVVVVWELSVPGPEHCKTALTTQKKGYHGIPRKLEFVYVASVFPERCKGAEAGSFEVWCLFPPE